MVHVGWTWEGQDGKCSSSTDVCLVHAVNTPPPHLHLWRLGVRDGARYHCHIRASALDRPGKCQWQCDSLIILRFVHGGCSLFLCSWTRHGGGGGVIITQASGEKRSLFKTAQAAKWWETLCRLEGLKSKCRIEIEISTEVQHWHQTMLNLMSYGPSVWCAYHIQMVFVCLLRFLIESSLLAVRGNHLGATSGSNKLQNIIFLLSIFVLFQYKHS